MNSSHILFSTPARIEDTSAKRTPMSTSHIDGKGLWASWTRNFTSPELALLDLFDNAIDATLHFNGKIQVYQDPPLNDQGRSDGIILRNNCCRPIPKLATVLTVFGSEKRADQIGENGVGVKQACAALSDLSLIISKNKENKFSIGLLYKDLQSSAGCFIPSFNFENGDTLFEEVKHLAAQNAHFEAAMRHYGGEDIQDGVNRLIRHLQDMYESNEEREFLVILHRVLQRGHGGGVKAIMNNLAERLPKTYLHIPENFKVSVDSKTLKFKYWEEKLLELHKFTLKIDPHHSFKIAEDWHYPNHGHYVCLYLGFDGDRCKLENDNKASLLIYSRQSGRLVRQIEDARGQLGVTSGGTDFAQGLTVILDDLNGNLPLTPTKQDIAFGQQATGKIHEMNLMSWIGAFTHLYYTHFLEIYGTKGDLRREVLSHEDNMVYDPIALNDGKFSSFEELIFKLAKGKIRCANRKKAKWTLGKDSVRKFHKPAPALPVKKALLTTSSPKPVKRKAMKTVGKAPKKRTLPDREVKSSSFVEIDDDEFHQNRTVNEGPSEESNDFKLKLREMQLDSVQKKYQESNSRLKEQLKENQLLKKKLETGASFTDHDNNNKSEENEMLRVQLAQAQEELRLCKEKAEFKKKQYLENSRRMVQDLKSKYAELEGTNENLNFKLQSAEVEKETLATQLEMMNGGNLSDQSQMVQIQKLQEEKREALETIHSLREMIGSNNSHVSDYNGDEGLRMELAALQNKYHEQQVELQRIQNDNTKLRDYSRNLQSTYESLKSMSGL
eukprot:CAMPEP_0178907652 /NCGR_PEP_ID=MMETSP0786-20121207/7489_1 /TAXON_ID=186022 /ORGANISM="Thalassionema frauenfeldii, Strain CCMP 1798" /LENGTH=781 /DNA_ID=CAMNT_0020579473 /DNA_START=76 /DNA_END=2421 /DNA_ORIENTATION=+